MICQTINKNSITRLSKNNYPPCFLLIILLFLSIPGFSQIKPCWFITAGGELPAINLSGNGIKAEQFDFTLGIQTLRNSALFLDLGSGLMGVNSNENTFLGLYTIFGIGANYFFSFKQDMKLGIELSGDFGSSEIVDEDSYSHNFFSFQGGIKMETANNFFAVLGIRKRILYDMDMSNIELFYTLGYKIDFSLTRRK